MSSESLELESQTAAKVYLRCQRASVPQDQEEVAGGWLSAERWQARVDNIRAQAARDDEDALLNATFRVSSLHRP